MNDVLEKIVGAPVRIEELKHKPGRRRTIRARGPSDTAIVKIYASARAPVVARRIESLAAGPAEPIIPRVVHVDGDRHFVVLSEVPGRPLREALLEGDRAMCARTGIALGTWHAAWHGAQPLALQPHTAEREVTILTERMAAASPSVAEEVADALGPLAQPWECTTVVHRDLYEEQILVDRCVGLIDLDDAAVGPPELDVGNLMAHLELLEMRNARGLAAEKRALLDGYAEVGPSLDRALLHRCRRLSLLRLACLNDDIRLVRAALMEGVPA